MQRRSVLIVLPRLALSVAAIGSVRAAVATPRSVEDLTLTLDVPDPWVPIPRAEIVEAGERARTAGAVSEWRMDGAWQRPPLLRWFTLPHMVIESQPAADAALGPQPAFDFSTGRAGTTAVYTHRARWWHGGRAVRLTLLALTDEQAWFEPVARSLRFDGG